MSLSYLFLLVLNLGILKGHALHSKTKGPFPCFTVVCLYLVQFTGGVLSVESCNCARMKNHVSSWTWRLLPPLKSKGCFSLPDYFSDISSWADMLNDVNCFTWTWASCGLAVPMYPTCTGVSVAKCGCPCVSLLGLGTALRTLLLRQGIRACSSTQSRGELENSRRYLQHTVGKKKKPWWWWCKPCPGSWCFGGPPMGLVGVWGFVGVFLLIPQSPLCSNETANF